MIDPCKMTFESLATAYAGAELVPTPTPFDPTGKLGDVFEASHQGYLDSEGKVDTFPPELICEVEAPEEPTPPDEPEDPPVEPPVDEPGDEEEPEVIPGE